MAILKFKKLVEDLENNTSQVLPSITKTVSSATLASSANYAGTARVAHYGSSGTGAIAGTAAIFSTGL